MRADNKSESFMYHKNTFANNLNSNRMQNCRRKLQSNFEEVEDDNSARNDRSVLSVLSFNDTRRVLRLSSERITKTFSNFRTTLGTLTQRFRMPTKRRQILEEGPMTPNVCATPQTYSRNILGRTPTKLYSPFSIESPYHSTTYNKENEPPRNDV